MINKISLCFVLFFISQVWASPLVLIRNQADLEDYMDNSKFNGVILVAKDKTILLKKAYGLKNLSSQVPLSTEDKFQIGSVSKQFVAAALLKLQEQGKLSLDDDLTKFFPEQLQLKNIKLRNILNHTSGVKNYTDQKEFWDGLQEGQVLSLEEISQYIFSLPFDFDVGKKWNYSNSGYILAGAILEKITGQSWSQFIEQNFLSPLQMNQTGYSVNFKEVSDVVGHIRNSDGELVLNDWFNLSWAFSAGGLYSTIEDLSKWSQIYDQSSLLSSDSKTQMQTPFLALYGLGVFIKGYNGQTLITHSGRTPGFVTQLHYLKESKLNVVTLNNVDGTGPDLSNVLLEFYNSGSATVLKDKLFPISQEALEQYVGNFKQGDFYVKIYTEKGKLFLYPAGQKPFIMKPVDTDSFNLEDISGEEFLRNDQGQIYGFKHFQNGRSSFFSLVNDESKSSSFSMFFSKSLKADHPIQRPKVLQDF